MRPWELRGLPFIERFRLAYTVDRVSGCWLWNKPGKFGYGRIFLNGRHLRAHVASFLAFKGDIPAGLVVLHQCDNRACVNPDHLAAGSSLANSHDMIRKGRQADLSGRRNSQARLSMADATRIRQLRTEGAPVAELARLFMISQTQVSRIANGHRWAGRIGSNHYSPRPGNKRPIRIPTLASPRQIEYAKFHTMTMERAREIRALRESGMLLREIAGQYGITETSVSYICRNLQWVEDVSGSPS